MRRKPTLAEDSQLILPLSDRSEEPVLSQEPSPVHVSENDRSHTSSNSPAQALVGKKLPNGWVVDSAIKRPKCATGGTFSSSYVVCSKGGERAFLKAMDFASALRSSDPAGNLQSMTEAFTAERNLLRKCQTNKLSRVIRMLDDGVLRPKNDNPAGVVQYIIFELADGDIRTAIRASDSFDEAWALRAMHHITTALQQLHSIGISHQDIKPSNILTFPNNITKVGDLGRAVQRGVVSQLDDLQFPGDLDYCPPELLYGEIARDWTRRRLAADMYLLGSTVLFLFRGVSMTPALQQRLIAGHRFRAWQGGGTYREILPFIRHAFAEIISDLHSDNIFCVTELSAAIAQLCDPDPMLRGHPRNRGYNQNQYSLERYISLFNRLARKAELSLKRNLYNR